MYLPPEKSLRNSVERNHEIILYVEKSRKTKSELRMKMHGEKYQNDLLHNEDDHI